jgi:hypothetical protein
MFGVGIKRNRTSIAYFSNGGTSIRAIMGAAAANKGRGHKTSPLVVVRAWLNMRADCKRIIVSSLCASIWGLVTINIRT